MSHFRAPQCFKTDLKIIRKTSAGVLPGDLVPGAGLEPARPLPGPRDFKSRVSTNSTIRAKRTVESEVYFRAAFSSTDDRRPVKRNPRPPSGDRGFVIQ